MISIIYGSKGTGKTKQIIDWANSSAPTAKGDIAYITDTNQYTLEINLKIRYVSCDEYGVNSMEGFLAFVKGMLAANHDINEIFVDGIARITKSKLEDMETLFEGLKDVGEKSDCTFVLTISSDLESMPSFIKEFVK